MTLALVSSALLYWCGTYTLEDGDHIALCLTEQGTYVGPAWCSCVTSPNVKLHPEKHPFRCPAILFLLEMEAQEMES